MIRFLRPILAILVSIGLFVWLIMPAFDRIKSAEGEIADYQGALQDADRLQTRIKELVASRSRLSSSDVSKLDTMVPNEVDEVEAIMMLDAVALSHEVRLSGIKVEKSEGAPVSVPVLRRGIRPPSVDVAETTIEPSDDPALDPMLADAGNESGESPSEFKLVPVSISFTVEGTYEDFKAFLADVERSLVFAELQDLSIQEPGESDLFSFSLKFHLYEFSSAKPS